MFKVGKNEPCPCGSGKKFKKCHFGREEQLLQDLQELDEEELGKRIVALPGVEYGHSREFADALDFEDLTGKTAKIHYVDFREYLGVGFNPKPAPPRDSSAGMIINPLKTNTYDKDGIYIAVTPAVNDSTLIHELAHVLGYLEIGLLPGSLHELAERKGIPSEHLDHTMEFARWMEYLGNLFKVEMDAEDMIVVFLKENGMLFTADDIKEHDEAKLTFKSKKMIRYLQENRERIIPLIRDREGYIGQGSPQNV